MLKYNPMRSVEHVNSVPKQCSVFTSKSGYQTFGVQNFQVSSRTIFFHSAHGNYETTFIWRTCMKHSQRKN